MQGTWDCGATTNATRFVTIAADSQAKVSIRSAVFELEDTVRLYNTIDTADTRFPEYLNVDVPTLRWRSGDTLEISYDRRAAVKRKAGKARGVTFIPLPR